MQNKLNMKSAALGMVAGAIVALSIGAAATPNTAAGRYKLVVYEPPNYTPAVFKIDTVTGQVWASSPGSGTWEAFKAPNAGN
jgi:hypothetical protein